MEHPVSYAYTNSQLWHTMWAMPIFTVNYIFTYLQLFIQYSYAYIAGQLWNTQWVMPILTVNYSKTCELCLHCRSIMEHPVSYAYIDGQLLKTK